MAVSALAGAADISRHASRTGWASASSAARGVPAAATHAQRAERLRRARVAARLSRARAKKGAASVVCHLKKDKEGEHV